MAGFDLTFEPQDRPRRTPAALALDRARARLTVKADDLAHRVRGLRAAGYHCSADVLQDRLDLVVWQLAQVSDSVPDGRFAGKVLVTPSIQSQFETPTSKSASV